MVKEHDVSDDLHTHLPSNHKIKILSEDLCFEHCINLAVCDVLHNKKNARIESTASDIDEDDNENLDFPDSGLIFFSVKWSIIHILQYYL